MFENRNVKLALLFSFTISAARGVWSHTTLSVFLKTTTDSMAKVGIAEGLQGIVQAVVAVASGVLTDSRRVGRSRVLKGAALVGFLGVAAFLVSLLGRWKWLEESDHRYWMIVISLGVWGAFQGLYTTSLDTIFADSVHTGQRSKFNTVKFSLEQVSSVSGPLLALCIFQYHGNRWDLNVLRIVFAVGVSLCTIPCVLLLLFSDKHTLGKTSEAHSITPSRRMVMQSQPVSVLETSNHSNRQPTIPYDALAAGHNDEELGRAECHSEIRHGEGNDNATEDVGVDQCSSSNYEDVPRMLVGSISIPIPWVILLSDVISGLGTGCSVKYFPLYFQSTLGLSPVSVNVVYVTLPVFMTLMSFLARKVAIWQGRIAACTIFSVTGSLALVCLEPVQRLFSDGTSNPQSLAIVMPLYFISTLQHTCRPLKKSLLMDFVPKKKRGRYNSVDSVTRFGWSGSAMIGGALVEQYGFEYLFQVTAGTQVIAAIVLLAASKSIPSKELARTMSFDSTVDDNTEVQSSSRESELQVPLLT